MSIYQKKTCICGNHYIVNKKYWLCKLCNYKRLHDGKTPQQVQYEKQKSKPKKSYQLKKSPIKYKRKTTGEKKLFLEIWEERPHFCSNPKCKKYLGEEPNVFFFSHIKSKGAHPELRLCKENIELLCPECHQEHEFGYKNKNI